MLKQYWKWILVPLAVLSTSGSLIFLQNETPHKSADTPKIFIENGVQKSAKPTKPSVEETTQSTHPHGDEGHAESHAPQTPQSTADGAVQLGPSFKRMDTQPKDSQETQLPTAKKNLPTDGTPLSIEDQDDPQVIVNRSFGHPFSEILFCCQITFKTTHTSLKLDLMASSLYTPSKK